MKLEFIDLNELKTASVNVRKKGTTSGDDLMASIRSMGVLQPLLVRPNCEGYEIIAGQRRYDACVKLAGEGESDPVPCMIMDDGDDAKAIEASLAENIARLPMDEIDQYKAFYALVKEGRSLEEIAANFGVTERLVKQRLAIAKLYQPILNAYSRDEIDPSTIRTLTMATTRQQQAWWKLFKDEEAYTPLGYALKDWLFGGKQIPTNNALFDIETYKGAIISDLFGEERYFADETLFWEYQSIEIARIIEQYRSDGWQDVVLLDVGKHWCSWDHVRSAKEVGGRVYVTCAANGEVQTYEGFITEKEHKKRLRDADKAKGGNTRPETTKGMQNYLALHRHAAVRAELLSHEGVALRLMVAQAIAGSSLWNVKADPQKTNTDATFESVKGSESDQKLDAERSKIRALLELDDQDADTLVPKANDYFTRHDVGDIFNRLCKMLDEDVMRVLAFVTAETLPSGNHLVEMLGKQLDIDMGSVWQPDHVFFDHLRDKQAINAIVSEIAGEDVAKANISATAKVQKSIIQQCLNGERTTKVENWLPRYMAFPMQTYLDRG